MKKKRGQPVTASPRTRNLTMNDFTPKTGWMSARLISAWARHVGMTGLQHDIYCVVASLETSTNKKVDGCYLTVSSMAEYLSTDRKSIIRAVKTGEFVKLADYDKSKHCKTRRTADEKRHWTCVKPIPSFEQLQAYFAPCGQKPHLPAAKSLTPPVAKSLTSVKKEHSPSVRVPESSIKIVCVEGGTHTDSYESSGNGTIEPSKPVEPAQPLQTLEAKSSQPEVAQPVAQPQKSLEDQLLDLLLPAVAKALDPHGVKPWTTSDRDHKELAKITAVDTNGGAPCLLEAARQLATSPWMAEEVATAMARGQNPRDALAMSRVAPQVSSVAADIAAVRRREARRLAAEADRQRDEIGQMLSSELPDVQSATPTAIFKASSRWGVCPVAEWLERLGVPDPQTACLDGVCTGAEADRKHILLVTWSYGWAWDIGWVKARLSPKSCDWCDKRTSRTSTNARDEQLVANYRREMAAATKPATKVA